MKGWKRLLELHMPYLALTLLETTVEGKRYVMIFADDFSDWKEFAIYTADADEKKIREIVREIEKIIEKANSNESYDPVPEIANAITELVDAFVVGEIPEEMGVCADDDYVAYPHEDERLSWPLCYNKAFARTHLRSLLLFNLIPEEWIPHVRRLLE